MTTLEVGGPAQYFADVATVDELALALGWAERKKMPTLILGGGSNLLIADGGFDGLALRIGLRGRSCRFITRKRPKDAVSIWAHAGEIWDDIVAWTVGRGFAGLECLSGIPGRVGATPIQNVGAYGQEVAQTIERVRVWDRERGAVRELSREQCEFSYRHSMFKGVGSGRYVVLAVRFVLAVGGRPTIHYPELERAVKQQSDRAPTVASIRQTVLALRRGKSMVLDSNDDNRRSAGSFFLNPIITDDEANAVREAVVRHGVLKPGEAMPTYAGGSGRVKLSAAWLIDRAGYQKGTHRGPVGLSSRHTLAIVNRGGATAAEIIRFSDMIRARVKKRFGVELSPEPQWVGFASSQSR